MMEFSERSEFVGANIRPEIKHTLQEHLKIQREAGNSISMSRWIAEAIEMRLKTENIPIVTGYPEYVGENLPFDKGNHDPLS
jgi:hypothetical protein